MKFDKPTDIALILPPHRLKDIRYSLGLLYIAGYLRDHGYDNVILENRFFGPDYEYRGRDQTREDIINKLVEIKPKIIGFTSSTIEIYEVVAMNRKLKSEFNFISIIGGPHATALPKEMINLGFNFIVIGEGEATALELVRELQNENPDFSKIKGIAYRNSAGEIIVNESRPLMDIANLSLPAYDKIKMEKYTKMSDEVIRGVPIKAAVVMASRGCPYVCTFCACNRVYGHRVRYRSMINIKQEIQHLRDKYNVEGIWFADDTMTISKEHIKNICAIMKELKMFWGAQARVDLADEKIIKLMKDSGCLQLDFGVESGSQRILDEIVNKKVKLEQTKTTFALCKKYGIRTHASFMLGLPTETDSEAAETLKFAQKLKPNWYAFGIFTPLPGTELYEKYYAPGEITHDNYKEVTFHKPSKKFDKSKITDLAALHAKWRQILWEGIKWREIFHPLLFIKLLVVLPNKVERLRYYGFKFRRLGKYVWNKIGLKFSLK